MCSQSRCSITEIVPLLDLRNVGYQGCCTELALPVSSCSAQKGVQLLAFRTFAVEQMAWTYGDPRNGHCRGVRRVNASLKPDANGSDPGER
jgi:hypothetical protein